MCDRVFLSDGRDAGTRGELRALLGVEPIYADAEWPDRSDDDCLCSCDVPGTAKAAGFVATYDAGDWALTPGATA